MSYAYSTSYSSSLYGQYSGHNGYTNDTNQNTTGSSSSERNSSTIVHAELVTSAANTVTSSAALSSNAATLIMGSTWGGQTGSAATVTYTFNITQIASDFIVGTDTRAFTSAEQSATLGVFSKLAAITHLTFQVASDPAAADITFYVGNLDPNDSGLLGDTTISSNGSRLLQTAVGIDDSQTQMSTVGTDSYLTLLHEIGHSVGLKHPGNYGSGDSAPFLSSDLDNTNNTVMSYFNGSNGTPSNYQAFDIEALHYLYGGTGGGDTGGGGGDTGGGGGDTGGDGVGNSDAFFASITATISTTSGTDANETIKAIKTTGDGLAGGHGNDSVYGGAGNDTIFGGQGVSDAGDGGDLLMGGKGGDLIYANAGDDTVYGAYSTATNGDGADTIYGGFGADKIYGNLGNDSLIGGGALSDPNEGNDSISGGYGNDTILGNGGNDTLSGGPGDDRIYGGFGNDSMDGGTGKDYFIAGPGSDTMMGGGGQNVFEFSNGAGNDTISDFTVSDTIRIADNIDGSGIHTAVQFLAHMVISGGNAVITFDSGDSLTLTGVTQGEIGLANIQIF